MELRGSANRACVLLKCGACKPHASLIVLSSREACVVGKPTVPRPGPDVTSGNLGLISGGTYDVYGVGAIGTSTSTNGGGTFTANVMAGHANENPAMRCALE